MNYAGNPAIAAPDSARTRRRRRPNSMPGRGSLGADHSRRANELEDHVGERIGRLFGNEATRTRKSHEPAAGDRVGERISQLRADERVLVSPNDQGWTVEQAQI